MPARSAKPLIVVMVVLPLLLASPAAGDPSVLDRAPSRPTSDPIATDAAGETEAPAHQAAEADDDVADAEETRVDLAERVPPRWLTDMTDDWPLTPERWRRRMPRECQTRGGYRDHCQGARLVPTPRGPALALARRLGLGQRATALSVMNQAPFPEWVEAVAESDAQERLSFPVAGGHVGRGFGNTREGSLRHRRHYGVDIGAPEGTPIQAARGGLVVYSDNGLTGYGNVVIILHREGFSTMYAHCQRTLVSAGQRVLRGQVIGQVGQTGFAPGPHLHFEWRQRGWARDPARQFLPVDAAASGPE